MTTTPARPVLWDLQGQHQFIEAAGVFDGISAHLARRTGQAAACMTGAELRQLPAGRPIRMRVLVRSVRHRRHGGSPAGGGRPLVRAARWSIGSVRGWWPDTPEVIAAIEAVLPRYQNGQPPRTCWKPLRHLTLSRMNTWLGTDRLGLRDGRPRIVEWLADRRERGDAIVLHGFVMIDGATHRLSSLARSQVSLGATAVDARVSGQDGCQYCKQVRRHSRIVISG
ncbi:MAG: hypothetical protein QOF31_1416 [Mycobacterium sp.]|jgi:hypothetical protein|nr:hypothetical protein [Mycobacterium sp.]